MHCTWTTGPDTGRTIQLAPGRHLVGRAAQAAVRCDDPVLEPHHLVLDIGGDGTARATQLTGRIPVRRADGEPITPGMQLAAGTVLELGSSTLSLHTDRHVPHGAATVLTDGTVVRSPRVVPRWTATEPTPPPPLVDDAHLVGGLLPAVLGLVGAAAVALLLRQPMFVLFGAIGALVAVGSWVGQHVAARRARRRRHAEHAAALVAFDAAERAELDAFIRNHRAAVPTVVEACHTVLARTDALWARRVNHADAFRVSLGLGSVVWRTSTHEVVHDLPVATDLGPDARLAVVGHSAPAVARAVVAQLTAQCGPADLRIIVVTARPERWHTARPLPHLQLPDGTAAVIDEDQLHDVLEQFDGDERAHLLIVTDRAASLATRTAPLRRALGQRDAALLAVLEPDDGVPHLCTAVLTLSLGPIGRWVADTSTSLLPEPVRTAGLAEPSLARHSAALATCRDPEDSLAVARLPRRVDLAALLAPRGWRADDVLAGWADRHAPIRTAIGMAGDGIVDLDLDRDGPHALLAGTTGSGKSELLRSLVLGLAVAVPPIELQLVLVDYKGGATFDELTALPHVAGVVTDLDDALADRALRSLHAELRRREAVLREHGASDLPALRARAPQVTMPRLVVVVDEFAALVAEQPDFLHALVGVAQRGRSLGVHLLLATQRPQGVISDDIRANTNLRIALRLHDTADAVDVVGDARPATLPRGVPGRAVMRLGADEHLVFQTAHLADAGAAVTAVCAAGALHEARGEAPPWPAPWVAPLPDRLGAEEVPNDAVGWCDDPDRQRRLPLRWSPTDGSIIVAGSAGSGVTSTLRTLADRALLDTDVHVYLLTAASNADAHRGFGDHPRAVVVSLHESERVHRLLHRLRMPDLDGARRVVFIDGLDTVRRTLDTAESIETIDALDEVLASAHDTLVIGTAQPSALPVSLLARCAHRWVLHLHDAHDAATLGVGPRQVPAAVPGRLHVAGTGLMSQLIEPSVHRPVAGGRPVVPVEIVPPTIDARRLSRGFRDQGEHGGTLVLPVGVDFASGRPWSLCVADGEHVLVLGGSRSGRSGALTRLARAWRDVHPDGRVLAVLPRRSALDRTVIDLVVGTASGTCVGDVVDSGSPVLVVCDDAELIDDPDGALATLAASRRDRVTLLVAARPDALRQRYGHWTSHVRHSRLGLVATGGTDGDADLLGTVLPRRLPVRPRPGLMWAIDPAGHHLVQVATDTSDRPPSRLVQQ